MPGWSMVPFPPLASGRIIAVMSDDTPNLRRYRFSLKTLLLAVTVALVALGGWVQSMRLQSRLHNSENENLSLRDALGYLEGSDEGDRYRLTQLGFNLDHESSTILTGSHLLRVENHEQYKLELTFYDGETQERKTEAVDLDDPVVAITYLPFKSGHEFFVQSTYLGNRKTSQVFGVRTYDKLFFSPMESSDAISDESVLQYFFYNSNGVDGGPNAGEFFKLTPKRMMQLCDKYHMQSVFFCVVPRDSH